MPEENKDDLKPEGNNPAENGQNGEENKDQKLTAEELQKQLEEKEAELAKLKSDNENYKQAIISKNAKSFNLSGDEEPEQKPAPAPASAPAPVAPTGDDEQEAWEKVRREAENISQKVYEEKFKVRTHQEELNNERVAIKKFFKDNPGVATNEAMKSGLREFYVNRNGKSVDGIYLDMQDALDYWAFKNNVELKPQPKPNNAGLASLPTGRGGEGVKPAEQGPVQEIAKYFPELAGKPQLIQQYKTKIENGEIEVPDSVRNLFSNI